MKLFVEKEAENFLQKKGFDVIKRADVKSKNQLHAISKKIPFPWAMKVNSKKIVHKKKFGGVVLNIPNLNKANFAFENLSKLDGFESATVQPMVQGEELIIGIKKTPEFGPVIMVGRGGPTAEQEKDVAFRVLPITKKDAEEMLSEIRFFEKLKQEKTNLEKIKKNILKISSLSKKFSKISELDINPLMVNQKSAQVVDARIVFD